jgi:hypothetical protein
VKVDKGVVCPVKFAVALLAFGAVAMGQSLSSLTCSPTVIPIGSSATCTATISSAASATGFAIKVSTTAPGVTVPSSVTIGWLRTSAAFSVTTTNSTPAETAVINATAGTVTRSATITVSGSITYSVSALSCTPTTLIPGQPATCTGSVSAAAPTTGLTISLTSSSGDLPVPGSVSIASGGTSFRFSATASNLVTIKEGITLTATLGSSSRSLTETIDPTPKFSLKGNNVELSLLANGAIVVPSVAPSGWQGTLSVWGTGYTAFDPFSLGSDGMSFHTGGGQNANTSFVNFTGTPVGQVFQNSSEVSFLLKSAYSFTERKALPQSNVRAVFEVYDNTSSLYTFYTYTTSTGQLQFTFGAMGNLATYTVPAGTEDVVFGKGVVAKISVKWTSALPSSFSLYINGTLVQTNSGSPKAASWTSLSALTIGSRSSRASGGGYYASDDSVAEFMVR